MVSINLYMSNNENLKIEIFGERSSLDATHLYAIPLAPDPIRVQSCGWCLF